MMKTIEKYQKCSYGALDPNQPINETQNSYQEYLRLKARVEILQQSQRNLLGEDLAPLTTKELEQLEHQLEASLKQIRSTRTQCILDQVADLQSREQMLTEANKALRNKLEDAWAQVPLRLAWEAGGQNVQYGRPPPQSEGFFQPLGGNSTLQIGYNPVVSAEMTTMGQNLQNVSGYIPGWML
ncbi:hypothetical protein SLA2020_180060 [Shorea laevis]